MNGRADARGSGHAEARDLAPAPSSRFALPADELGLLAPEEREIALGHVRALLSQPTAPYAEDHQVAAVRAFAAARPPFELTLDRFANPIVRWPGDAPSADGPALAFSAHLDHPGFLFEDGRASFHGGFPERALPGNPVRFFDRASGAACATARVASVERDGDLLACALADVRGELADGMLGMWDLTPGRIRGRRLSARVCDDLLGAAAILTVLDLLAARGHEEPVLGIFTRAEETGFVGCQGLLRDERLRGVAVVGLECSPARATARIGLGPVVRVGDRMSVFDPAITHHLQEAAAGLAARDARFRWQRALMDGGSCESTAYNQLGVPAGALCIALGSYHNLGPGDALRPELVDWHDFEGLVALMLEAVRLWPERAPSSKMLARLNRIWEREYNRLARSAERIARR